MELPNDIWIEIVKQSKKTNDDIVADMNLKELRMLEIVIAERKTKMYNDIKSKLDKYDIIEVFDDTNTYVMDCVVIDKIAKRECCIRVCELRYGNKKTIFGNYLNGNVSNEDLCLFTYNIKIKSKLEQRNRENIKIANSLKIGDVFCYSLYSGYEWCRMRNSIFEMETFEDGIKYAVVNDLTPNKIVIVNYHKISNTSDIVRSKKYIDKSMILNKIEYEDNEDEFIKYKKLFGYRYILDIDKINDITQYFKDVNKKQLIKLQKRLKIRP
jgi:hypothetical protein